MCAARLQTLNPAGRSVRGGVHESIIHKVCLKVLSDGRKVRDLGHRGAKLLLLQWLPLDGFRGRDDVHVQEAESKTSCRGDRSGGTDDQVGTGGAARVLAVVPQKG